MARIKRINKCRKPQICGSCRKTIQVGQPYLIARRRYMPDVVRCTSCGMQQWETSSSEFELNVGAIKYNWQKDITVYDGAIEEIVSLLGDVRDDASERRSNMPDNLQDSPVAELLDERIDELETAIDELQNIDLDELKSQVVESVLEGDEKYEDEAYPDYEDLSGADETSTEMRERMAAELNDLIVEAIEAALESIQAV